VITSGFDCSFPRTCCGTDTHRYCCLPSSIIKSSSSSSFSSVASMSSSPSSMAYADVDNIYPYTLRTSNISLNEKWFLLQMCITGILLAILLLLAVIIYLCLTTMRHSKAKKNLPMMTSMPLPLPLNSSLHIDDKRLGSSQMSTINSDTKSHSTDVSMMFSTSLNIYPTSQSRCSTDSSSYYLYPNEFEYLCK
jgi:hypothetical protein